MINRIVCNRKLKWVVISLLFLLSVVSLYLGISKAFVVSIDFQWDSAKILSLGVNPYEASLDETSEYYSLYAEQYGNLEANQFPSLLFFLFPYLLFSAEGAQVAWLISNLIFLLCSVLLLRVIFWNEMGKENFIILILLLISSCPIRYQLFLGQHTIFSLFFFLLAYWLMENGHENTSGIALAISYFKYSITAPLMLVFLYKKKYKAVFISLGIHVILTLVFALYLHTNPISLLLKPLEVASWLSSEGYVDLNAIFGALNLGSGISNLCTVVIFLGLIVWIFQIRKKARLSDIEVINILIYCSLIFMYHRRYDYFVLILPVSYIFCNEVACREYCKDVIGNVLRISTLYLIFGLFIVYAFLDPITSVGNRLNNIIGSAYSSLFSGYEITLKIAFWVSLVAFCIYEYRNSLSKRITENT